MNYLEIAVTVPAHVAESVAWALTEQGLPGVVIEERKPGEAARETSTLKAYLPEIPTAVSLGDLRTAISRTLESTAPGATFEVATRTVPEEDWATSWQQYWHVQKIGDRLVVRPSWEEYEASPEEVVITLDPKQAFGTGTHPTTRLCMRILERVAARGPLGMVFDVGAGSGILAIAALLLGAPEAVAVDTDPVAVAAAEENAEINQVTDRMRNLVGSSDAWGGQAPIIFANILAEVIIEIAQDLYDHTAPGGTLIASGIIERKADAVEQKLQSVGFEVVSREQEGEWVGIEAKRPG